MQYHHSISFPSSSDVVFDSVCIRSRVLERKTAHSSVLHWGENSSIHCCVKATWKARCGFLAVLGKRKQNKCHTSKIWPGGGCDLCNDVLFHYTFRQGFIRMSHPAYQPSWFTGFLLVSYSSSTPSCPDNTCTNSSIHCAPSRRRAKTVWKSQELEPFVLHFPLRLELRPWWQVTPHSGVQNSTFNTTVSSGQVQTYCAVPKDHV